MPERWTLPRAVNRLHRDALAPVGFERQGNRCVRVDNGLRREVRFYTPRWGDPATKGVQVFLIVQVDGLRDPVVEFRRDALWTHLESIRQLDAYPRPPSDQQLPSELIDDVAGPGVSFLCQATDLLSFADWATDVHANQGIWGPFRHVFPKGTAALQAAALAAAKAGDKDIAHRAASAVLAQERNLREVRAFQSELRRVIAN